MTAGLNTTGGISTTGFVTYSDLTESKVLSWSNVSSEVEGLKTRNEEFIKYKISPPAPSYVLKELPW